MRSFTVVGFWDDSDTPVSVAVIELIGGGQMLIEGGQGCSEGGPWALDVDDAPDPYTAETMAVRTMQSLIEEVP